MKYCIIALIASLVFVSCSQTKEFTIPTMSGTKIYSPNGVEMNVEKTDCLTKIKIKKNKFLDKTYCAYLLSYDDSTKMLVPFGMDYTLVPKSRAVWRNVGYGFCTAGIATFSVGFIGSLLGNVTNASWLHDGGKYSAIAGGVITGIGSTFSLFNSLKGDPFMHKTIRAKYNFDYRPRQMCNQDLFVER